MDRKMLSNCLTRNNLIVIFLNVIFFMIVQTLFFNFVASQQYLNVLKSKVDIINILIDKDPDFKQSVSEFKKEWLEQKTDISKKQEEERRIQNNLLSRQYSFNYIVLAIIIFFAIILPMKSKDSWSSVDTLNVIFVILAYSTELLFFFFIVKKYEFVGDNYILVNLVKELDTLSK